MVEQTANCEKQGENRHCMMKICASLTVTKINYLSSIVLFYCAFVYGIGSFIIASSLVDLKVLMDASIASMSLIFPIVSISFTVGSLVSGVLFRAVSRHLCCFVVMLLMALSVTLIPHSPNISFLYAMAAIKGFTSGVFNTAQVVWIVDIWQKKSGPFLQALQFCVSVGSFVAPLMNKPFLIACPANTAVTASPLNITSLSTRNGSAMEVIECSMRSTIHIPYAIEGLFSLCAAFLLFCLFILIRVSADQKVRAIAGPVFTITRSGSGSQSNAKKSFFNSDQSKVVQMFYIINGFVIIGLYFGSELTNFQLLATFTRYLNPSISGPDSALLMAIYGGAFTLFRGLSILVAIKIRPQFMIIFNMAFMIVGNVLVIFYGKDSRLMLIVACALMGTGYSSTLPSVYTLLEKCLPLNDSLNAIFSFAGGLMSAVNTLVFGKLIDVAPLVFIYANLLYTAIVILFIVIAYSSKYCIKSRDQFKVKQINMNDKE